MKKNLFSYLGLLIIISLGFISLGFVLSGIKEQKKEELKVDYDNYVDLGIVSPDIPNDMHKLIEGQGTYAGILYMTSVADPSSIRYSIDKGESWTDTAILAILDTLTYDVANSWIFGASTGQVFLYRMNTNTIIGIGGVNADTILDVFQANSAIYEAGIADGANATLHIYEYTGAGAAGWTIRCNAQNMGAIGGRTYAGSQFAADGTYGWFLFKWSNENVKLWRWTYNAASTVMMEDLGANTQLPPAAQGAIAYDGNDLLYFVLQDTGDSKYYLHSYSISTDNHTKLGEYNIALQLERNTELGVLEKGFHISEDKIYQIPSTNRGTLNYISNFNFGDDIKAMTDNFIIDASGNVYEFQNLSRYIFDFERITGYMRIPTAFMTAIDNFKISAGMFITISDTFTTAGSTSTEIIFEGYVEPFQDQKLQRVTLRSPANELKNIFPEGDYSGRSDQIIVSLLTDYAKYITPGTLSAGQAMGQIHYNGDKSLFQILFEFALTDNFIWGLSQIGVLYYNDGTIDSIINIAESDPISKVRKYKGPRAYNEIKIKGTIAGGNQVEGDIAENLQDQQENGYNPFIRTISHLNTNALCTITETNILTRWGTQATLVEFFHRDINIGVIQSGETITFQNNKIDPNVGSAQFLIKLIIYNAKNQSMIYTISDRIV